MTISTICLHAFIAHSDGNVEYCDDSETPTGWTVYARSELEDGEFDHDIESDHTDFEEALHHAEVLASAYGVPLHHY